MYKIKPLHLKNAHCAKCYFNTKVKFDGTRLIAIVGFGEGKVPAWYCGNGELSENWRNAKRYETVEEAMAACKRLKRKMGLHFLNPITPLVSYYSTLVTLFNFSLMSSMNDGKQT